MREEEPVRIILVTGGVVSGVGKGIVSSSIGTLLKAAGYRVTAIKIDPYLNVDAGTFSPFEHGEVFVLDDGSEVDLDLGNYERFLGIRLCSKNNITSGKIYKLVIEKERQGAYLGKTVQTIPHITDAIIEWVECVSKIPVDESNLRPEICVVELGGTVGDIEIGPYTMAFNRASFNCEPDRYRFMSVHVTKLLDEENGEIKTKPAQNSLSALCQNRLDPDLLMCRSKMPLSDAAIDKIVNFSLLSKDKIISLPNASSIYQVPVMLYERNVLAQIQNRLKLTKRNWISDGLGSINDWRKLSKRANEFTFRTISPEWPITRPLNAVNIALVAKYVSIDNGRTVFTDAYASVIKALQHSGIELGFYLTIRFINSESLVSTQSCPAECCLSHSILKECHGILVPGGFGDRGVEGKIEACKYARENKIPFLGICLGLQCAAIEFARNVCNIPGANSTEFSNALTDEQQIVIEMPEHAGEAYGMGATQRLGRRTTAFLTRKSLIRDLYKMGSVDERHRHRYEVNPTIVPRLSRAGLLFVGMGVDESRPSNAVAALDPNMRSASSNNLIKNAEKDIAENTEKLIEKIEEMCKPVAEGTRSTPVRMEMAEMDREDHPFFVGVQYHPEFLSRPTKPSPVFFGFVKAANDYMKGIAAKNDNATNMNKNGGGDAI